MSTSKPVNKFDFEHILSKLKQMLMNMSSNNNEQVDSGITPAGPFDKKIRFRHGHWVSGDSFNDLAKAAGLIDFNKLSSEINNFEQGKIQHLKNLTKHFFRINKDEVFSRFSGQGYISSRLQILSIFKWKQQNGYILLQMV